MQVHTHQFCFGFSERYMDVLLDLGCHVFSIGLWPKKHRTSWVSFQPSIKWADQIRQLVLHRNGRWELTEQFRNILETYLAPVYSVGIGV